MKAQRLYEWMTIQDLRSSDATSPFLNQKYKIRLALHKGENINSKLVSGRYSEEEDSFTYTFKTVATTKAHTPEEPFKKTLPDANFKVVDNPSKEYKMQIKILNFRKQLDSIITDNTIRWSDIKRVLETSYIQVFCDDPSFQYQTANYNLSQVDASIYPTAIPPKKWGKIHGTDNFLCKHLKGLLDQIGFFLPQMASLAGKVLKNNGYNVNNSTRGGK